ncbi:MAG TPA: hypothetical protein PLW97_00015 [Synergistaceae bacterium]|nr:hypothetical protein [Synergistaceae bacterium]
MRKKLVLGLIVVIAGLLLGAGAFLATNMGTAFIGKVLVEQAKTQLDASLTFQELKGNPLRGYTITNMGLLKEGKPLVRVQEGFIRVRLMPLLRKSFELDRLEIKDFQAFPRELAASLEALKNLPAEALRPLKGSLLEVEQQGDTFYLGGKLQYGALPLEGGGSFRIGFASGKGGGIERLEMLRSSFSFGVGGFEGKGLLYPRYAIEGELHCTNLEELLRMLEIPGTPGLPSSFTAFLEASGTGAQDVEASGRLLVHPGKLFGIPLGESVCDFSWARNLLKMDIPQFLPGGIPFRGHGSYQFYEKPGISMPGIFSLFLSAEKISLEELRSVLPRDLPLGGIVEEGSIQIEGKDGEFQGDMQLYAPRVTLGDEVFSELKALIKLREGNTLHITARGEGWGGNLALSGKGSFPGPSLDLTFNTKGIRLERLQAFVPPLQGYSLRGDVNAGGTVRGVPGALVIAGEVDSPKIAVSHTFVDNIRIPYTYREKEQALVLKKAQARLEEGTLHLDGTLRNLQTSSPVGEGTLQLQKVPLASLSSLYPQLEDAGLKGELTLKASFRGPLASPAVEGAAYVPVLTLSEGSVVRHAKGEITLAQGDLPKLLAGEKQELAFNLSAADIRHPSGVLLENPRGELAWNMKEGKLRIPLVESTVGKASLRGQGEITLGESAEKSAFRFELAGENLDASRLYRTDEGKMPLRGTVQMRGTAEGTFGNPRFEVQLSSPQIRYDTLTVQKITLRGAGGLEGFSLSEGNASLYGGSLNLAGGVSFGEKGLETEMKADFANLDLQALGKDFPKLRDLEARGLASGTFSLRGPLDNLQGSGNCSVPEIHLFGLKGEQVSLPLTLEKGTLRIAKGKATLYGGTLGANFSVQFAKGAWRADAKGELISMGPLLRDLTRSDKGLHCNGVLDFKGAGNFLSGALRGEGSFATSQGHLTGVPWADLIAKLHGGRNVAFQKISGTYELDAYRFLLRSGEAQPLQGDPLYQYLRASGPISYEGPMNIAVDGLVNVQLVNALTGGAAGGVAGLIQNPGSLEGLLQGVVGGAMDLGKSRDFRKVTFTLEGTAKKPEMRNLQMEQAPAPSPESPVIAVPETPQTGTSPTPTPEPQSVEDVIKEELKKEIFKLFE